MDGPPPSGWYPDPTGAGERSWDGRPWPDVIRRAAEVGPAPRRGLRIATVAGLVLVSLVGAALALDGPARRDAERRR